MATHNATHQMKTLCSTCSLRELYLPVELMPNEFLQLDAMIRQSRRLKKGKYLFRASEPFTSLFAIRAGFFKATVASQGGRDRVTGFFMSGELIEMDGICSHIHSCDAVTLKDSEVYELPFTHIEELSQDIPSLRSHFFHLTSREIVRDQSVMLLLGNMRAKERLAAFLLNLSQHLYSRGFVIDDFTLRTPREEIGNCLGLELETVSHTLSKLHHGGLISVEYKHIKILDATTLKKMVSGCSHTV